MSEEQLRREIKNNQSLHQMNKTLTIQNEMYATALLTLKNAMLRLEDENELDESHIIAAQDAEALIHQVVNRLPLITPVCQCERWKRLYTQESEQSYRLSKLNNELTEKLTRREKEQALDQTEVRKMLEDYLELYRKMNSPQDIALRNDKLLRRKKDTRSASKSKQRNNSSVKTDRKQQTNDKISKQPPNIFIFNDIVQREAMCWQVQLTEMRAKNTELQSLIRVYRQRERQRILRANGAQQ